jgi:hypothetical protein
MVMGGEWEKREDGMNVEGFKPSRAGSGTNPAAILLIRDHHSTSIDQRRALGAPLHQGMTILVVKKSGKREDGSKIAGSGQEIRIREALGTAEVGVVLILGAYQTRAPGSASSIPDLCATICLFIPRPLGRAKRRAAARDGDPTYVTDGLTSGALGPSPREGATHARMWGLPRVKNSIYTDL